jgi:hypothetical protein
MTQDTLNGSSECPREATEEAPQPELDWTEFIVKGMCSLCGQKGIIDTRGIRTPANFECGGLHYCICPNGRALKVGNAPKLEWLNNQIPAPPPATEAQRPPRERMLSDAAHADFMLKMDDLEGGGKVAADPSHRVSVRRMKG